MANKSSTDIGHNRQLDIDPAQLIEMKQETIIEEPVIILQPSGHIYYSNDAFLEMIGGSSQNIYTRHFFDFIHREDAQPVLDIIISLMGNPLNAARDYVLRIKSASGSIIRKNAVIKIVWRQSQVIGIKIKFTVQ